MSTRPRPQSLPPGRRANRRERLPYAARRAQIVAEASEYFAEHGLAAETRSLATACGISQRLLYRFFPTKAALVDEVVRYAIIGPFEERWLVELRDRERPVADRLNRFYRDYMAAVLTRRWMRLFLHATLASSDMGSEYIGKIIKRLLETIVQEAADELDVELPDDDALIHEIGWTLHGAVSHLAIRKHIYAVSRTVPESTIIALQIRNFLAGFPAVVAAYDMRPSDRLSSFDDKKNAVLR
jgi:AcrR family transcriptional regulator